MHQQKWTQQYRRLVAAVIVLAALAAGFWLASPSPVMADALQQSGGSGETQAAPATETTSTFRPVTILGILILLAPLVFQAWKSRGKKEPDIKASCCAPVVDPNKRPFQIQDDPVEVETPANQ